MYVNKIKCKFMEKMPVYPRKEDFYGGVKLVRRVFCTLVLFASFNFGWVCAQQTQEFTINFKDQRIIEVFDYIQKNSKYIFTYNSVNLRSDETKVSHSFKNASLPFILKKCLENTRFSFELIDNHVVVKSRVIEVKEYRIKGKVVDEKGNPLPGVTILLDGMNIGFATDIKGEFNSLVPVEKGVLNCSYVGFLNLSISSLFVEKPWLLLWNRMFRIWMR